MDDVHSTLSATWRRIDGYLHRHAPRVAASIAPPASAADVAELQAAIGRVLPNDLAASLRIHNGQVDPTRLWVFTDGGRLLDCRGIAEMWRMTESINREESGRSPPVPESDYVPPLWWKSSLIPFTFDDVGDMLCTDTDPQLGRARGHVVMHVHNDGLTRPLARNFSEWLASVADKLEAGALVVDEHTSHLRLDF
jgi:cell wall assembly regulator SMI1